MNEFVTLFLLRQKIIKNHFKYIDKEQLIRFLVLSVIGIIFLIGDYLFFYRVIDYLKDKEIVGELLIIQLIDLVFLTFLSMLIFSNIITSLSISYLSADLDFLLSSPLRVVSIFISKFMHNLVNSSYMVLIFGFPIFIACGKVYQAGYLYYVLSFFTFIVFLFPPAGIGILITMFLMRFFPARRTYQVFSFLGLIFIAGLIIFFRFARPEKLLGDVADDVLLSFLKSLEVPDFKYLPSSWATQATMDLLKGRMVNFLYQFGLLIITAIFVLGSTVWIASKIYYTGWSKGHESKRVKETQKRFLFNKIYSFIVNLLPLKSKFMVIKDVKLFFRNSTQWSQLFLLGALIIIYIFNIRNLPLNSFYLKNLVSFLNLGLAGFVLAAISLRFVFPSTSLEGKCFWIVYSSPLNFKTFLWNKFWVYLLPLLFLGEILVIISNILLGVDIYMMFLSVITIFFITIGLTGLGIGLGAIYPKFEYESEAEIAASMGGIIYMILSLIYIGLIIIFEARPVWVHFGQMLFPYITTGFRVYLSYFLVILLTALVTYWPMKRGIRSLMIMEL